MNISTRLVQLLFVAYTWEHVLLHTQHVDLQVVAKILEDFALPNSVTVEILSMRKVRKSSVAAEVLLIP